SHKMEEVFRISDRITVLRDGKLVSTDPVSETSNNDLIRKMVGRELKEFFPRRDTVPGQKVLELKNLSRKNSFTGLIFALRKGEVLGLAGLVGSGRTEILETIFGSPPAEEGEVNVSGKPVSVKSPRDSIRHGIALVPEDRKTSGLSLLGSVLFNTSLPTLSDYARRGGILSGKKEKHAVTVITKSLQVKAANLKQSAGHLSGGNQQKIVLAKWLLTQPEILLFDEPTRGIDIGAKTEIYRIINKLVQEGISILMVSSEMPELMGMCDRILGIRKGSITREFHRNDFDQEKIMAAIMN
ncbi:MAG: sugar ABC transporter ATP-binding protein, partial [Bacteroidales bacterium]|nr:sugar ABC transporter ATP-binding protein [Bacteroidales bacterium]